jgi:tetratricopeptide (TPR) repeat protein
VATVAEAFALALRHQQAGNLQQAEQLCRQILKAAPGHADSHHLLGVLAYQTARYDEAVLSIRLAVTLNPVAAVFHVNLGMALEALGQPEEAVASYYEALRLQPKSPEAHNNLGNTLRQMGKLHDAIVHCREALRIRPGFPAAANNLGNALVKQGQIKRAVAAFQLALRRDPSFAEAANNLGTALTEQDKLEEGILQYREALRLKPHYAEAHYNLGVALEHQDKIDEAMGCYRQSLELKPDFALACNKLGGVLTLRDRLEEALGWFQEAARLNPNEAEARTNLGNALARLGKLDEAVRCHRQALVLNPDCAEAHTNLGNVLARLDKLEEAARCHQEALRVIPNFVPAWTNLGSVRTQQNRLDEALSCYAEALRHEPGHAQTHFNRALVWLLLGNWAEGWPEYEWRWQTTGFARHDFAQSRWDGSPLNGRTLLVLGEQGLGDTLQFIRFLPLVKEQGGRVIFQCLPQLLPLLAGVNGIDALVARGAALPAFDVYTPLLSLPGFFHISPENVPAPVPYLRANQELVAHWRRNLIMSGVRFPMSAVKGLFPYLGPRKPDTGRFFRVGIAWQGTTTYRGDSQRSIPLANFARLALVPGVQLISLQKGPGTEQVISDVRRPVSDVKRPPSNIGHRTSDIARLLLDLADRLDEGSGAFLDTAAVMMNIDLVITSDTSIAHLAGSLGVAVWVALALVPDWRWLLRRHDTPWYPTMRLFRQTQYGQWDDVFDRIMKALQVQVSDSVHGCASVRSGGAAS